MIEANPGLVYLLLSLAVPDSCSNELVDQSDKIKYVALEANPDL